MDNESLTNIGAALANVAAVIAERHRQRGQGAKPPFQFVGECIDNEAVRVRGEGQAKLADGLIALRTEIEGLDNG